MAVKNANAKTWNLPVEWNGKRYSEPTDVPAQTIPIEPPVLGTVQMGATNAVVSFTPGEGYDTLIPQYSTDQSNWTSLTSDLTSPFSFTGLTPETLYYFRALPNGDVGEASNTVSGTTIAEGAYVGAGQLETDEYVPERMTLEWSNPTASPGTGSRYLYANSQFDYRVPFVPMGGCPPYRFALTGSSTAGVSITAKAPSWNPYCYLWAEITIDRSLFTTGTRVFTVECIDQAGTSITRSLTVTHNDSQFIYVDSSVVSSGSGTFASPLKDIEDWFTSSAADTTYQNKICVYRAGTYSVQEFDGTVQSMRIDSAKPRGHIAYPGETVVWNMGGNVSSGTSGATDWFIQGIQTSGGASSTNIVRLFSMLNTVSRAVFYEIFFDSPTAGSNTTDNTSCIYSSSGGAKSKSNISIVDCEWQNLTSNTNGFSLFDFYACDKTAVVGGTARNISAQYGAWAKNACYRVFIAGLDMYDLTGNTGQRLLFTENGSADTGGIVQAIYNKVAKSTDGLVAQKAMLYGDNGNWGTIYQDRNTVVGRVGVTNASHESLGTCTINRNLVFSNITPKIESSQTVTNNVTDTRTNIGNYLESNGNVRTDYANYGKVGATVKAAA